MLGAVHLLLFVESARAVVDIVRLQCLTLEIHFFENILSTSLHQKINHIFKQYNTATSRTNILGPAPEIVIEFVEPFIQRSKLHFAKYTRRVLYQSRISVQRYKERVIRKFISRTRNGVRRKVSLQQGASHAINNKYTSTSPHRPVFERAITRVTTTKSKISKSPNDACLYLQLKPGNDLTSLGEHPTDSARGGVQYTLKYPLFDE